MFRQSTQHLSLFLLIALLTAILPLGTRTPLTQPRDSGGAVCPTQLTGRATTPIVSHDRFRQPITVQQKDDLVVDPGQGRFYLASAADMPGTLIVSAHDVCSGASSLMHRFPGYQGVLALDTGRHLLVLSSDGSGSNHGFVAVLNTVTFAVCYTRKTAASFVGVTPLIDAADGRLAIDDGDNGLLLLNETTGRVLRRLRFTSTVGGQSLAEGVVSTAVDPTRHRIAVVTSGDEVVILDAVSGQVLHRGYLAGRPNNVIMDTARGRTVLTYSGDMDRPNRVVVLDTMSGHLIRRAVLGGDPTALALDPSTRRLFIPLRTQEGNDTLLTMDIDTGQVITTTTLARANGAEDALDGLMMGRPVIDVVNHHVLIGVNGPTNHDGAFLGNGRLFVLNGQSGKIVTSVELGHEPGLIGLDPAADRAIVADSHDGTFLVLAPSLLGAAGSTTIVTGPAVPTPAVCRPYTARLTFLMHGSLTMLAAPRGARQKKGPYLGTIAAGPRHALWFVEIGGLGSITTAGRIRHYALPSGVSALTQVATGAADTLLFTTDRSVGMIDGQGRVRFALLPRVDRATIMGVARTGDVLWVSESGGGTNNRVVRIEPTGSAHAFCLPGSRTPGITATPDGAVWVTQQGGDSIARVSPSGQIADYPLGSVDGSQPGYAVQYLQFIAPGPLGALWFTEFARRIGYISAMGAVTIIHLPASSPGGAGAPFFITQGPEDTAWFTEIYSNNVGRISARGTVTEFALPQRAAGPLGIATGSDGALWVTEMCTNAIARITLTGHITEYPVTRAAHGDGFYCVQSL